MHNLDRGKKVAQQCGLLLYLKKQARVNDDPMSETSPDLVALHRSGSYSAPSYFLFFFLWGHVTGLPELYGYKQVASKYT
jgi:hypothetical protein